MAGVTLQQIFQQGDAAFAPGHRLPDHGRAAARAMMTCRTAVLGGGHVQRGPEGHVERLWYNSCRHRRCPPWSGRQLERWLAIQKARLLMGAHDPAICTMPDARRGLWLATVQSMTDIVLTGVRQTLFARLADERYLGARPGLMATWHPWSQTLVCHPPRPCLVTGGGVTEAGEGRPVRHGLLLPVRVVMARWRGQLLAAVDAAVQRGTLPRPDGMPLRHWARWRNTRGRPQWHGHMRERYPHGVGVLTYVARDLRGGPIANQRLVSWTPGAVTCGDRLNGEGAGGEHPRQGRMRVSIEACIRRYRVPVPAPGTRVVRSSGLDAPTQGEALAGCREQLGQGPVAKPGVLDWQMACRDRGDAHPERCPRCGRRLVRLGVIRPARIPPPAQVPATGVACTAGHLWVPGGRRWGLP